MSTILLIDDDPDCRRLVAEFLELLGYQVLDAEDGQTGLEQAIAAQPDLIVCDVSMPGLNGYQVLQRLRENQTTAFIPFIFYSGEVDLTTGGQRASQPRADAYVSKSSPPQVLLETIQTYLPLST